MKFESREYQGRIIQKTVDLFNRHKNIMIESPTGSGKTIMGMKILEQLGGSVVWVTMRRNLLVQASKAHTGLNLQTNVHFDTIFGKSYPRAKILVVDEAQHDATASMNFVYTQVKPDFVLGLTATPFRTDKMTLCFEKVVKDIGIQQLIRLGYLSKFEHFSIPDWNPKTVTEHYLMDREGYGQSVMFFHKYDQCLEALAILKRSGVRADIVTGHTDRESQIQNFEQGKLDVLLNMMVLTEGFDYPELKSVFVRDSVKLPTIQMAGRVLRLDDQRSIKRVVQSNNTSYPFMRIANPIRSFHWDRGQWLSLTMNENIDRIVLDTAKSIAFLKSPTIPTKQPKFKG